MLTIEQLNEFPVNHIIDSGITYDPKLHSKPLQWVAVKDEAQSWAIYQHLAEKGLSNAVNWGVKCRNVFLVKKLVPCDEEAFSSYRFS